MSKIILKVNVNIDLSKVIWALAFIVLMLLV